MKNIKNHLIILKAKVSRGIAMILIKFINVFFRSLGRILLDFIVAFIDLVVAFFVLSSIIFPSYYFGYWIGIPLTVILIAFILFLGKKARQRRAVHKI
jgi:hypothetical protein